MKLKKIFTFVVALVVCLSLAACGGGKKCEHVDANDDLKCDKCGEAYDDGTSGGQHTCVDNNGDKKCDECGKPVDSQQTGVYKPKWDLNAIGFNGQGMNVKIKCLPVSEFDPFDAAYSGTGQDIKMRHQQLVQQAYNIKIKYVAWDESEAWGPTRAGKVVENFTNGSYQEDDIYVVNIASNWIPTIVKSGALAELASIKNGNVTGGILANYNAEEVKYEQDPTINEVVSASNKVYGIATGKSTPDYFIYYNIALVESAGVSDPAELWLKGEWTLSRFKEWVEETQNNLAEGKSVLDLGYPEFAIGMVASTGNQFVTVSPIQKVNLLEDGVTGVLKTIQTFYKDGYYNSAHQSQDVTDQFTAGDSVMAHGSFWFIKADDRFNAQVNNLRLGVVPYPAADGDNIVVEYTSDPEEAITGADGEPLQKDGQYVAGLDMSGSSFQVPFTGTSCFSILDYTNGKNGINAEIVANILIDLYAGQGADPNQTQELTEEQGFRIYLESLFNREIDIEVVMSVYDCTYYEIFESVAMTVGGGSLFGESFWPTCGAICRNASLDPYTELNKVYEKYRNAMIDMGYNPR